MKNNFGVVPPIKLYGQILDNHIFHLLLRENFSSLFHCDRLLCVKQLNAYLVPQFLGTSFTPKNSIWADKKIY